MLVNENVPPADATDPDGWRTELVGRYTTVSGFLKVLPEAAVIFSSNKFSSNFRRSGPARYADGLKLHQLRHSSATHLGEANVSANVIMAKTGHKSLRSVQRYVKPGLAAVHAATETLSGPRRRG